MEIPFYCIVNDQAVKDSAESAGVHQPEGSAGGRHLTLLAGLYLETAVLRHDDT
jgi:hypothetical protein